MTARRGPTRLRASIAAALIVSAFATSVNAQEESGAADSLWEEAVGLADADSAAFLYELYVARHGRSARVREAQFRLGQYLFARAEYRDAHRQFAAVAGKGDLGEEARLGMARCRLALGQFPEARVDASDLMRSARTRMAWEAGFVMALALQGEGRTREALSEYIRLLERPPGPAQPAALLAAARAARSEGQRRQAQEFLDRLAGEYRGSFEAMEADTLLVPGTEATP